MPLYEYECDSCGHRFEVIQKFSDAPIDTCPTCGKSVHKLMSSPAIQFKGSGWYITDYAKKDSTSATKAGTAKEGSTSGDASPASASSGDSAASASAPSTPPAKPAKSE
jgi:putative FmdB family regulatory protein